MGGSSLFPGSVFPRLSFQYLRAKGRHVNIQFCFLCGCADAKSTEFGTQNVQTMPSASVLSYSMSSSAVRFFADIVQERTVVKEWLSRHTKG